MIPVSRFDQIEIAAGVRLDRRLALFHEEENWLAIADPHFGYELSQRTAGRLVPMWGMEEITARLLELLGEFQPARLIILGDLVHDRAAEKAAGVLLDQLGELCEPIVIAGNHDRQLSRAIPLRDSWQTERFYFHHGHCAAAENGRIQIIGHHHPAGSVHDGAGLRLKFPAFVQDGNCWIMPAFSPWASGTNWQPNEQSRVWLCTPQRILPL